MVKRSRKKLTVYSFIMAFFLFQPTHAQNTVSQLGDVTHAAGFMFLQRDGNCTQGSLMRADATSVIVNRYSQPPVVLSRDQILQVGNGKALLFSARSSWSDVMNSHVYPREAFVLTMKAGKRVKGAPVKVLPESIVVKHGFVTAQYQKTDIATIDYFRLKPATDNLNFVLEEAPYFVIFYPEFYYRAMGLEGYLPVRLYDAAKPEDDAPGIERCFKQ